MPRLPSEFMYLTIASMLNWPLRGILDSSFSCSSAASCNLSAKLFALCRFLLILLSEGTCVPDLLKENNSFKSLQRYLHYQNYWKRDVAKYRNHCHLFQFISKYIFTNKIFQSFIPISATAETRTKAPIVIRPLRLKFHCLNPLTKNPKEAEMGVVLIPWISCC